MFNFFEELPECFAKWLHHCTVSPAVCEGSNFAILSATLLSDFFGDICPAGCEVLIHDGFSLHFPDG